MTCKPSGIQPAPVPPALLARIEHILRTRNVDGKVPVEIANRILDDMHDVACRVSVWSCTTYERYGLHANCHRCHPPLRRTA